VGFMSDLGYKFARNFMRQSSLMLNGKLDKHQFNHDLKWPQHELNDLTQYCHRHDRILKFHGNLLVG
jgi:hypothetical protein